MKKLVNTKHPIFVELWDSQIAFSNDAPLPDEYVPYALPELQSLLNDDLDSYDQGWYFENDSGTYIVARVNGKYLTLPGYPYSEPYKFDSLEEALATAFSYFSSESLGGEWDDEVVEYSVDGEWLIREVQS